MHEENIEFGGGSRPFGITIMNVGSISAAIVVEGVNPSTGVWGMVASGSVPAGGFDTFSIDAPKLIGSTISKVGVYRITSDEPISAIQWNALDNIQSNDAALLLPKTALTTAYRVMAFSPADKQSFLTVVATEDNTKVTITPAVTAESLGGIGVAAGVPRTFGPLSKNQAVNIRSTIGGDLTSSTVGADHPVAVFAGDVCTINGSPSCDMLVEQTWPLTVWGSEYVACRAPQQAQENVLFRVMAIEPGTTVVSTSTPGSIPVAIPMGSWHDFVSSTHVHIKSTQAVAVATYLMGDVSPSHMGDPSFTQVRPFGAYGSDAWFIANGGYDSTPIVLAYDTTMEQPWIDGLGQSLTAESIDDDVACASSDVTAGMHQLGGNSNPTSFTAQAFGFAPYASYAYPVAILEPTSPPTAITAPPIVPTPPENPSSNTECVDGKPWPASNGVTAAQGPMVLEFLADADVFASPYYVGGSGSLQDPAMIHVPGCLQAFFHVTNLSIHAQFYDMHYWVPMNAGYVAGLGTVSAPADCTATQAVYCIHDLGTNGRVSLRDFYPNHGIVLMTAVNAPVYLLQSPSKPVPTAGSLGTLLDGAAVTMLNVVWYGIDGTTAVEASTFTALASDLQTDASWCYEPAAYLLPPLTTGPIPWPVSVEPGSEVEQVAGSTMPHWSAESMDDIWQRNLDSRHAMSERNAYYRLPPAALPDLTVTMVDATVGSTVSLYATVVGGAFIGVHARESAVRSVGTSFVCSGWGVFTEDSSLASIRTKFDRIGVPYFVLGSEDEAVFVPDSPALGGTSAAFESLCDIFQDTFPAVVVTEGNLTLYGAAFTDGQPVHASDAPTQALIWGMSNLIPIPDNIGLVMATYDPSGQGQTSCAGPIHLPLPIPDPPRPPDPCEDVPLPVVCYPICDEQSPLEDLPAYCYPICNPPSPVEGTPVVCEPLCDPESPVSETPVVCRPLCEPESLTEPLCEERCVQTLAYQDVGLGPVEWSEEGVCVQPFEPEGEGDGPEPETNALADFINEKIEMAVDHADCEFPFWCLLDGQGNLRTYEGLGVLPVVGANGLPLVGSDLSSIHYLVLAPNSVEGTNVKGAVLGFYNFMLKRSGGVQPFGPFEVGSASGGYGFQTGMLIADTVETVTDIECAVPEPEIPCPPSVHLADMKYYYQEESFPQWVSPAAGTPIEPIGNLPANMAAMLACFTGAIKEPADAIVVDIVIERGPTDCGNKSTGTRGTDQHFVEDDLEVDLRVHHDLWRRLPLKIIIENDMNTVDVVVGLGKDAETVFVHYGGGSEGDASDINVEAGTAWENGRRHPVVKADHRFHIVGKIEEGLTVTYLPRSFTDPGSDAGMELLIPPVDQTPLFLEGEATHAASYQQPAIGSLVFETTTHGWTETSYTRASIDFLWGGERLRLQVLDPHWEFNFLAQGTLDQTLDVFAEKSTSPGPIILKARLMHEGSKFEVEGSGDGPKDIVGTARQTDMTANVKVKSGYVRELELSMPLTEETGLSGTMDVIDSVVVTWGAADNVQVTTPEDPLAYLEGDLATVHLTSKFNPEKKFAHIEVAGISGHTVFHYDQAYIYDQGKEGRFTARQTSLQEQDLVLTLAYHDEGEYPFTYGLPVNHLVIDPFVLHPEGAKIDWTMTGEVPGELHFVMNSGTVTNWALQYDSVVGKTSEETHITGAGKLLKAVHLEQQEANLEYTSGMTVTLDTSTDGTLYAPLTTSDAVPTELTITGTNDEGQAVFTKLDVKLYGIKQSGQVFLSTPPQEKVDKDLEACKEDYPVEIVIEGKAPAATQERPSWSILKTDLKSTIRSASSVFQLLDVKLPCNASLRGEHFNLFEYLEPETGPKTIEFRTPESLGLFPLAATSRLDIVQTKEGGTVMSEIHAVGTNAFWAAIEPCHIVKLPNDIEIPGVGNTIAGEVCTTVHELNQDNGGVFTIDSVVKNPETQEEMSHHYKLKANRADQGVVTNCLPTPLGWVCDISPCAVGSCWNFDCGSDSYRVAAMTVLYGAGSESSVFLGQPDNANYVNVEATTINHAHAGPGSGPNSAAGAQACSDNAEGVL